MIECAEKYNNINLKVYLINVFDKNREIIKKLFVGKNVKCKDELIKLNTGKRADESKIQEEYSDEEYSIIHKHIKTSDLIFEDIFPDDTFEVFRKKLFIYLENTNDDIYMWIKKNIVTKNELLEIISNIFGQSDLKECKDLVQQCKNIFDIDLSKEMSSKTELNKIGLYDILSKKIDKLHLNIQLGFSYINTIYSDVVYIESNPYDHIYEDKNFISDDGNKNLLYNMKNYKNILLNSILKDIKEINLCYKKDLLKYINLEIKTKKLTSQARNICNSIVYKYFPLTSIEISIDIINRLEKVDERIIATQFKLNNNNDESIQKLKIELKPIYIRNTINLDRIFKNIETTETVPYVSYRSKTNVEYKLSKYSLNNIYNKDKYIISAIDLKKWTEYIQSKTITRGNETMILKVFFKKFGNYNKFITIILFDNGMVKIIYDLDITQLTNLEDILESFKKINKLLNNITNNIFDESGKYKNTYSFTNTLFIYPELNKELFYNINSLITISDFQINLDLNKINYYKKNEIEKLIAYMYPYFDDAEDYNQKNVLNMKYKRVNNYFTENEINNYLKNNSQTSKEILLELLVKKFGISFDDANKYYEMYETLSTLENTRKSKDTAKYLLGAQIRFNNISNRAFIHNIPSLSVYCRIKNLLNTFFELENIVEDKIDYSIIDKQNEITEKDYDDDLNVLSSRSSISYNSDMEYNSDNSNNDIYNFDLNLNTNTNTNKNENNANKNPNAEILANVAQPYTDILQKLKKADKGLFVFPSHLKSNKLYSSQCQFKGFRQPIVLTREEKKYIDENYPNSYTGYVQEGSTKQNKINNFYICPKIWCRISKVSLTQEQLNDLNGKCPSGEAPLLLQSSYWLKKNKTDINNNTNNNELEYTEHYPGFLGNGKTKHPNGKLMLPCCFKKPQKLWTVFDNEETDNLLNANVLASNNKYILTESYLISQSNRYCILPPIISSLLQDEMNNKGRTMQKNVKSFVRKGTMEQTNGFLSTMVSLLNIENINNVTELINLISSNITPFDYIRLNNGNTLKLYYNPEKSIYERNEFLNFKTWFISNTKYINKFKLNKIVNLLETLDKFTVDINEDQKILNDKKIILREYIIYNSLTNFINYLYSDIVKTHEELLDLFSYKYSIINKLKKVNVILLNENQNNASICCSKFFDGRSDINLFYPFVFVLHNDTVYEPLMLIQFKKGEVYEIKEFLINEKKNYENVEKIINIYKNNCNIQNYKIYINPNKLESIILSSSIKNNIKFLVITSSFKSIGFILKNNLFIPFNRLNTIYTDKFDIIYIKDIYKLKVNLTVKEIREIYNGYNTLLSAKNTSVTYYDIFDIIYKNDLKEEVTGLILQIKNYNKKIIIPINFGDDIISEFNDILEANIDEDIFIDYREINEEKEYNKLYYKKENIVNDVLLKISNIIVSDSSLFKELGHITHQLNPFSANMKLQFILDLINPIINKISNIEISKEIRKSIALELLYKDITFIIKQNLAEMKLNKHTEILFDQNDVYEKKIETIINSVNNPFKTYLTSIEDSIKYINININENFKKWKIITDNYETSITPKEPWGNLMGKSFNINIPFEYNNNYILDLFKKISNLKSDKKMTIPILREYLKNTYISDYSLYATELTNKKEINEFLKMHLQNISFKSLYSKTGINNFEKINKIFESSHYHYSFYELKKLAEFININLVIIGKKQSTSGLPNAVLYCNNGSEFYIIFHVSFDYMENKYNKFQIVLKEKSKIILLQNDFGTRLWEKVKNGELILLG
jgi:hypothetical protein